MKKIYFLRKFTKALTLTRKKKKITRIHKKRLLNIGKRKTSFKGRSPFNLSLTKINLNSLNRISLEALKKIKREKAQVPTARVNSLKVKLTKIYKVT